jgi:hypothetical protein
MSAQQLSKLILKTDRLVVLLLVFDVFLHLVDIRGADGECTIAVLPVEGRMNDLLGSFGGFFLHFLYYLADRQRTREHKEKMHMIRDTAYAYRRALEPVKSPAEVFEYAVAMIFGNKWLAILGAEYQMHNDAG